MSVPLNRQQLKDFTAAKFIDNILQAITPEDARDVVFAIIDSTGLILEELGAKADLENGKLKLSQLPISASDLAGIPIWNDQISYTIGKQVTYQDKIWQSKINNNLNIPPSEGSIWKEVSGSHIQNTDSQLQLPDGTVLTALYILQQLQAKIGIELINQPNGVLGLNDTGLLNKAVMQALLDDLAESGNDITWSIDQIKAYLADRLSTITSVNRPAVATIAARNALLTTANPPLQDGESIWVTDATGDATVHSGWAIYRYFSPGSWEKVIEKESLDIDLSVFLTKADAPATVRNTILSGLDTTLLGNVLATDPLLQAIGKLQRQATSNNTLSRTFYLCPEFAGLATTARFTFTQKFTITGNPSLTRLATVSYQLGSGTVRTDIASINADISAAVLPFELSILVTFASGQNQGNLSLPCLFS